MAEGRRVPQAVPSFKRGDSLEAILAANRREEEEAATAAGGDISPESEMLQGLEHLFGRWEVREVMDRRPRLPPTEEEALAEARVLAQEHPAGWTRQLEQREMIARQKLEDRRYRTPSEQKLEDREATARRKLEDRKFRTPSETELAKLAPMLTPRQAYDEAKKLAIRVMSVCDASDDAVYARRARPKDECYNCRGRHNSSACPYRRGTYCGTCGEPGMNMGTCPFCNPKEFGITRKMWAWV